MNHSLSLRWLGVAGFQFYWKDQSFLIDPFISRSDHANPKFSTSLSEFSTVSLIMISHGHFDHAMDGHRIAQYSQADVYAPKKICAIYQKKGVLPNKMHANESSTSFLYHGIECQVILSQHIRFDMPIIVKTLYQIIKGGIFKEFLSLALSYPMGSNSNFLMNINGYKILYTGSGGGNFEDQAKLHPNCLMLPFAGRSDLISYYYKALCLIQPEIVILHHFDMFYPHFCVSYPVIQFKELLAQKLPSVTCIVPVIGEKFYLPL